MHGNLRRLIDRQGDILNFGLAVEKARGAGVDVEMVVVGDDVGVGRERSGKVGRRGFNLLSFFWKIEGRVANWCARNCWHVYGA